MRSKIDPLMLFLSAAWIGILGTLGVSALVLKRLAVSTRIGISHNTGLHAEMLGWLVIAFALLGVLPLLARSRFKRQLGSSQKTENKAR